MKQTPPVSQQVSDDYKLLLTPPFADMTKITDNLFLTGVGGMTRTNFAKNHIDFVLNITTDAPFWQDTESMRIALEDEAHSNMLPYFDLAVDKIQEVITKRNAHVLVHCVAGVSRSATIVIAYLMKYRRMDLRSAFNYCYNLRPVIRPNNGFFMQLINYEQQLVGRPSAVQMIEADVEGTLISVPNFFLDEHPRLVLLEVMRTRDLLRMQSQTATLNQLEVDQQQQQQQQHQQQPQQNQQPPPPPQQQPEQNPQSQLSQQSQQPQQPQQPQQQQQPQPPQQIQQPQQPQHQHPLQAPQLHLYHHQQHQLPPPQKRLLKLPRYRHPGQHLLLSQSHPTYQQHQAPQPEQPLHEQAQQQQQQKPEQPTQQEQHHYHHYQQQQQQSHPQYRSAIQKSLERSDLGSPSTKSGKSVASSLTGHHQVSKVATKKTPKTPKSPRKPKSPK